MDPWRKVPIALVAEWSRRVEEQVRQFAHLIAMGCQFGSIVVLAVAAIRAGARLAWHWRSYGDLAWMKEIWLGFAASLILSLEFALAADIAETAVAPSWDELGQLAAIAGIRTVLNLFLERDLEAARRSGELPAKA